MKAATLLAAFALLLLLLQGCSGARGVLTFDGLRYPVSSSSYLYASDRRPVTHGELQQVGAVSTQTRVWSIMWSAIPLTPSQEMSDAINEQIEGSGGEGATDLRVLVQNCGTNYIPFIHWLPIYPGCALVTLSANVVKLPEPSTTAVALAAPVSNPNHGRSASARADRPRRPARQKARVAGKRAE